MRHSERTYDAFPHNTVERLIHPDRLETVLDVELGIRAADLVWCLEDCGDIAWYGGQAVLEAQLRL